MLIAVTAGTDRMETYAKALVERWRQISEIPILDCSDSFPWKDFPRFSWAKTTLWRYVPLKYDRVLWVDADCFPLTPFTERDLPDVPFAARFDTDHTYRHECKKVLEVREVPQGRYFNGGVWFARRADTEGMFEELQGIGRDRKAPHGDAYEQSWLNILVQRRFGGWTELDPRFNWRPARDNEQRLEPPYIMHFIGRFNRTPLRACYLATGDWSWSDFDPRA